MRFLNLVKKYWQYIIIFIELIAIITIIVLLFNEEQQKGNIPSENISKEIEEKEPDIEKTIQTIKIDIKGAVKKPGVYEMTTNNIINDAITKAGGLKSNGTTKNINLSKKLTNEMIINVFTTNELKKQNTPIVPEPCKENTVIIEKCENASIIESIQEDTKPESSNNIEETKDDNQYKVNINTASLEELMTLSGIGESKALNIITYREKTQFKTIEEIMNVSGIGESAFAKIKENIEV